MVRLDLAAVLLAVTAVARAVTANTAPVVPGAYVVEYDEDQVSSRAGPGDGPAVIPRQEPDADPLRTRMP